MDFDGIRTLLYRGRVVLPHTTSDLLSWERVVALRIFITQPDSLLVHRDKRVGLKASGYLDTNKCLQLDQRTLRAEKGWEKH